MPDGDNIIVTGIPRSGTTLAAALIDSLPDSVCLNEPGWHTARAAKTASDFAQFIIADFHQLRQRLLDGDPVPDRRSSGNKPVTNYYAADSSGKQTETFQILPFTRAGLSEHFTLAIKHNGPYLAVLPELIELGGFTIIAIVRNPLDVIASWRRLQLPISRGEMPNAVPFWPELAQLVAQDIELLEKQVKLYDLMCARIYALRQHIRVITYEALIKNPEQLGYYVGKEHFSLPALVSSSSASLPPEERERITAALKKMGRDYTCFYPELETVG